MFDFDCENIDKQDEEQNQTLMQLINPRKKNIFENQSDRSFYISEYG
jgi:hypothetical protein